jgi:hypothetical protein
MESRNSPPPMAKIEFGIPGMNVDPDSQVSI